MVTIAQELPKRIINAIEEIDFAKNHIIYYDRRLGWVCQQRDGAFIDSLSEPVVVDDSSTNLTNEARPLEKLGPFGRFNSLLIIKIIESIYL